MRAFLSASIGTEGGDIMSLMNIEQIMDVIPHRYPFLLIDTIEEITDGKRAVGKKCVSGNEQFFQGHFPGNPVMPGVLIIEALAQVGAVALLSCPDLKGKTAYFAGIDNARFRKKVIPGDVLKLETEIIKIKGPMGIGNAVATVDGVRVAEARLTFAIG
jgi:3-hydroxyacyl-[acyl-carrier-protein] dehydratase